MGGRHHPEARLSELPAVHEIAARLHAPHALAVAAARQAIAEVRQARLDQSATDVASEAVTARAEQLLSELEGASGGERG